MSKAFFKNILEFLSGNIWVMMRQARFQHSQIIFSWRGAWVWGYHELRTDRTKHNQLWAVYQECLPLDRCAISEEQKGQMLCVGDSEQPRNSACMGDSGGNNIVDIVLQRKGSRYDSIFLVLCI